MLEDLPDALLFLIADCLLFLNDVPAVLRWCSASAALRQRMQPSKADAERRMMQWEHTHGMKVSNFFSSGESVAIPRGKLTFVGMPSVGGWGSGPLLPAHGKCKWTFVVRANVSITTSSTRAARHALQEGVPPKLLVGVCNAEATASWGVDILAGASCRCVPGANGKFAELRVVSVPAPEALLHSEFTGISGAHLIVTCVLDATSGTFYVDTGTHIGTPPLATFRFAAPRAPLARDPGDDRGDDLPKGVALRPWVRLRVMRGSWVGVAGASRFWMTSP